MLEGNPSFLWLCRCQGSPEIELLQGLRGHLVTPRVQVSKSTSCNRVRRVQPSLPGVEGQQYLLSLPAPMALCQVTPKNQPMGCLSLTEWITLADEFTLA